MAGTIEIFAETLLHSRRDNDSGIPRRFIRRRERAGDGSVCSKGAQVFSNPSNGSNGSKRRNLEIIGFRRLCSSSSEF